MITTTFSYHNTNSNKNLEDLIQKKLNKMVAKYDFIVKSHVYLSSENDQTKAHGKICKIQLSVPGPLLFAVEKGDSFEMAIHKVFGDLERQLYKKKEKMKAH